MQEITVVLLLFITFHGISERIFITGNDRSPYNGIRITAITYQQRPGDRHVTVDAGRGALRIFYVYTRPDKRLHYPVLITPRDS